MAENTLLQRLDGLDARFEEIGTLITDPNVIADQRRYVKLTKEYKSLETLLNATHRYRKLLEDIEQARLVLDSETDEDMRAMAREEIEANQAEVPKLEEEIKLLLATLTAAMNMNFRRVWGVFQPHTFSRTKMLLDDFAKALSIPDTAVISEILPVRETNIYNIYAEDLCAKVNGSVYKQTFDEITDYVCENARPGDLILTMGGGNVYMCANQIVNKLKSMYAE